MKARRTGFIYDINLSFSNLTKRIERRYTKDIAKSAFVLHRAFKTHLLTNQNARTNQIIFLTLNINPSFSVFSVALTKD